MLVLLVRVNVLQRLRPQKEKAFHLTCEEAKMYDDDAARCNFFFFFADFIMYIKLIERYPRGFGKWLLWLC